MGSNPRGPTEQTLRIMGASTRRFVPIELANHTTCSRKHAAPVAVRRERGVDMRPCEQYELFAFMAAGPSKGEGARRVRAQIFECRGGVMPLDWCAAEEYKETCELLESSTFVDDV